MGASSEEFVAHVYGQLAPMGNVGSERFFGGTGLRSGGVLFGFMMDNALYFAVDDALRKELAALGSSCFSYDTRTGRVEVNRFFEVPAEVLEDQARLVGLAKASVSAARTPASGRKGKVGRKE